MLKNGFSTGHGFLREPNSIRSAAALACIIIQSNQNDMFGGQSINALDFGLSPYVKKSFKKALFNAYKEYLYFLYEGIHYKDEEIFNSKVRKDKFDLIDFDKLTYTKDRFLIIPYENPLDGEIDNLEAPEYIAMMLSISGDAAKRIYNLACKDVEEETLQAMEAMIHNFNTLHSRAGSQTPFSSINFGCDTSEEGRLVSDKLLDAIWNGLGHGETAIFPISIFQIKTGINYNPEDPNYDLFKKSIKISAKRLFPNFVNEDAPYNAQYYKKGDYNSLVAVMGCADGDELVTYSYRDKYYCEGFKRLWDRVKSDFAVNTKGISSYIEPENLKIWDGDNGYVEVKTVVQNPDQSNWVRVSFDNGRSILVTEDHPLYLENKGRTHVKDLEIGDSIKTYWGLPIKETASTLTCDGAYVLGLLLVDGCYDKQLKVTLDTRTEQDIEEHFVECVKNVWNKDCTVVHYNRGEKGTYDEISVNDGNKDEIPKVLSNTFDGLKKIDRKIPEIIFNSPKEVKLAFMAGMIDGDGHISHKSKVQIGSINKELSLQQLALAQSLGIPAKLYLNRYKADDPSKIRYRVEYSMTEELAKYLASSKKSNSQWNGVESKTKTPSIIKVTKIEKLGYLDKKSYDVETSTDHFILSFINSGNCRTRTMGNINGPEESGSRGNFAFNTINLPYCALQAREEYPNDKEARINRFYELFDNAIDLSKEYLEFRYNIISHKKVKNFPFLMQQGVWMDSEKLKPEDEIAPVLKHSSLSIGFCGLAEALVALIGSHHGETEEARTLGLEIIQHLRNITDRFTTETHMNWSTFSTPAESTAGSFLKKCKKRFGVIPGVTDREYLTNSFHCPVYYPIKAMDKIKIEGPYHALCNAGSISYIEMDGDPLKNLKAFEAIVRAMHDANMSYCSINHMIDRDPVCGYTGIIENECPHCHRKESKHTIHLDHRLK